MRVPLSIVGIDDRSLNGFSFLFARPLEESSRNDASNSLSLSLSLKSPLVLAGLFCALACFLKATKEQDQERDVSECFVFCE